MKPLMLKLPVQMLLIYLLLTWVLTALCKEAQLVIANDSGISHVAAAVGARQITLVGVTDPKRTGPWNPNAIVLGEENRWPTEEEVINKIKEICK